MCNVFVQKQGWPINDPSYAVFNDYMVYADMMIPFSDILFDLTENIPSGTYEEYYDYNLCGELKGYPSIDYYSYYDGIRHPDYGFMRRLYYRIASYILWKIDGSEKMPC